MRRGLVGLGVLLLAIASHAQVNQNDKPAVPVSPYPPAQVPAWQPNTFPSQAPAWAPTTPTQPAPAYQPPTAYVPAQPAPAYNSNGPSNPNAPASEER